jgi:hypothetical protein
LSPPARDAENIANAIEIVRATHTADRQVFLAETLQPTESEGAAFLPLDRPSRADKDKLSDSLVNLVLEYADIAPNLPETRAGEVLKEHSALERNSASKRVWWLKWAGKVIPATRVLRWTQRAQTSHDLLSMQTQASDSL